MSEESDSSGNNLKCGEKFSKQDVFTTESVWNEFSPEQKSNLKKTHLFVYNLIDSTNTESKRRIEKRGVLLNEDGTFTSDGENLHKTVIASAEQSAGRGRLGRAFYSPSQTGIYFSLIYVPRPSCVTSKKNYNEKQCACSSNSAAEAAVGVKGESNSKQCGSLEENAKVVANEKQCACSSNSAPEAAVEVTDDSIFNPATFTVTAAVCVCRAISKLYKKQAQIKWVNDIYLEGKKICGILTEGVTNKNGKIEAAIIGIGINISTNKDLPEELSKKVGGITNNKNNQVTRAELLSQVIEEIFTSLDSKENVIPEYRSRSMLKNKTLSVTSLIGSNESYTAKALDITDDAGLLVELPNGEKKVLHSGEVTLH